jgi:hypothetical protein
MSAPMVVASRPSCWDEKLLPPFWEDGTIWTGAVPAMSPVPAAANSRTFTELFMEAPSGLRRTVGPWRPAVKTFAQEGGLGALLGFSDD